MLTLAQNNVASGDVQQALLLMAVGMAVVFGALVVLLAVILLVNFLGREAPAVEPESKAPAEPQKAPQTGTGGTPGAAGEDQQFIAVLAAAATAAIGQRVRIRRVRFVGRPSTAWAQLGRHGIMTSHRPQSRNRKRS